MIRSSFIFKENQIVKVEGKLDGTDIDDIGNLVDLPRLIFINEECGNLQVVVDGREVTRNINRKKKSDVLQAYRCPLCDKCYRGD